MRAWIPGDGGYGATLGSAHQNLFMAYVEHMFYTWTLHMDITRWSTPKSD